MIYFATMESSGFLLFSLGVECILSWFSATVTSISELFLFHFAFVFPLEANKIYNMHLNDIWIKKWKKWWKKKIQNTHSPWNIVLYMFIACIYSYSLYIFITNIAVWATERKKGCFNDTQNTSHFKYIVLWSFLKDLFKLPNLEKKYSIILKLDLSMYLSYYTCIGI